MTHAHQVSLNSFESPNAPIPAHLQPLIPPHLLINKRVSCFFYHIRGPMVTNIQAECLVTLGISISGSHGLVCAISIHANCLVSLGPHTLCNLCAA